MFYGQFLLHTRCDAVECGEETRDFETTFSDKTMKEAYFKNIISDAEATDITEDNIVIANKKAPWEGADEIQKQSSSTEASIQRRKKKVQISSSPIPISSSYVSPFAPPGEKPSKQSLELVEWLKKMTTTKDMLIYDQTPVLESAKEFLFPCSQDEFTLSDNLQVRT